MALFGNGHGIIHTKHIQIGDLGMKANIWRLYNFEAKRARAFAIEMFNLDIILTFLYSICMGAAMIFFIANRNNRRLTRTHTHSYLIRRLDIKHARHMEKRGAGPATLDSDALFFAAIWINYNKRQATPFWCRNWNDVKFPKAYSCLGSAFFCVRLSRLFLLCDVRLYFILRIAKRFRWLLIIEAINYVCALKIYTYMICVYKCMKYIVLIKLVW